MRRPPHEPVGKFKRDSQSLRLRAKKNGRWPQMTVYKSAIPSEGRMIRAQPRSWRPATWRRSLTRASGEPAKRFSTARLTQWEPSSVAPAGETCRHASTHSSRTRASAVVRRARLRGPCPLLPEDGRDRERSACSRGFGSRTHRLSRPTPSALRVRRLRAGTSNSSSTSPSSSTAADGLSATCRARRSRTRRSSTRSPATRRSRRTRAAAVSEQATRGEVRPP